MSDRWKDSALLFGMILSVFLAFFTTWNGGSPGVFALIGVVCGYFYGRRSIARQRTARVAWGQATPAPPSHAPDLGPPGMR